MLLQHLPAFQEACTVIFETVFVPKAVARQLVLVIALETGVMSCRQLHKILRVVTSHFSSKERLTRQLQKQQDQAETQDEWMDLAERIDSIQGNDVWRSNPDCQLYERERISARIDEFVHLMRRGDIFDLMFVLRGGIGRNKFGLLHQGLFTKALAGSKLLIETYHNVVCAALDFVCDAPVPPNEAPIPTEARLAFFNETRHSYGRTALLLSGGAALGFYHVGVVKTLMENRLMPRVIGGSSAGSILCAMIGTRTDDECFNDLFEVQGTIAPGHSGQLMLNFFRPVLTVKEQEQIRKGYGSNSLGEVYRNTAGGFHDAKRTWQIFVPIGLRNFTSLVYDLLTGNRRPQSLLEHDTEHFRNCVRANVGRFTFQEAFDRTGRILNITVTPQNPSDPPRLLNYLTAPHVMVWSAAVASSSLPGVFESNRLWVKDADGTERYECGAGVKFSDGSMEQDLPMQQLSEMFNVNHFVISQANPHAVMFASYNQEHSIWSNPIYGMVNSVLRFLKGQLKSWLIHAVDLVGARRIAPLFDTQRGLGVQFFTQEYEGRECDISLIPWHSHRGLVSALLHCIYNPSEAEFRDWIMAAERETWKFIPAIKSHIAEEITLDRAVQRLRKRVVVESFAKKRQDSTGQKMGDRVPSFFTSPSLVNLGGLGVSDQTNLDGFGHTNFADDDDERDEFEEQPPARPSFENHPDLVGTIPFGWGGQGLQGNRSSNSLQRNISSGSGLFIDDEDPQRQLSISGVSGMQIPGELTTNEPSFSITASGNLGGLIDSSAGASSGRGIEYVKTTSMAHFYYRKTGSRDHLQESGAPERIRLTKSHAQLEQHQELPEDIGTPTNSSNNSRKTRSSSDVGATSYEPKLNFHTC